MLTTWSCRLKFYSVGTACLVAATISTGQDFGINIGRTWTGYQSLRAPVGLRVYIGRNFRNSQGGLHLRVGYERSWSTGEYNGRAQRFTPPTDMPAVDNILQPLRSRSQLRTLDATFLWPAIATNRATWSIGPVIGLHTLLEHRKGLITGIEQEVSRIKSSVGLAVILTYHSHVLRNAHLGLEIAKRYLNPSVMMIDGDDTFQPALGISYLRLAVSWNRPPGGKGGNDAMGGTSVLGTGHRRNKVRSRLMYNE